MKKEDEATFLQAIEDSRNFANKISKSPEDAIQDATVMALTYLEENDLPVEPTKWFMTLVRYANSNKVRKDSWIGNNSSKIDKRYSDQLIDPYPGINAKLDLDEALSSLGPDEELARLYYVDGKTMQEIAEIFGKSKPTISRQISRIGRELKVWAQAAFG